MQSKVLQIGDCNGGATSQAIMTELFAPYIGKWLDIYLDDLIIYSDTAKEHLEHLKIIIDVLRREQFLLSEHKLQLFTKELKTLGHIIDDKGIRMDPHKVESISNWKVPTSRELIRGFLGAVGYLAPNVPQICLPMGVLTRLTGDKVPFKWTFTEQRAFDQIKELVQAFRDHHRISLDYSPGTPSINIVTDASASGIGRIVSQGEDWKTAPVASFFSAKLGATRQNYSVYENEMFAGVETMLRHWNLLQGAKF